MVNKRLKVPMEGAMAVHMGVMLDIQIQVATIVDIIVVDMVG
jgi:hypothetical protein